MGIVLLASPNGSLVIMDAIDDGHGDADIIDHDNDDGADNEDHADDNDDDDGDRDDDDDDDHEAI